MLPADLEQVGRDVREHDFAGTALERPEGELAVAQHVELARLARNGARRHARAL
jgi:hypothetical protein